MNYLVFNQEGEMLDVLNFNLNELALFKAENTTYIVTEEDSVLDEDAFALFDEDESDIIDDDDVW